MKTINDYTIYCTPEQTKKALELGAPIENRPMFRYGDNNIPKYVHKNEFNKECFSYTPTAEQMIGWLEDEIKGSVSIDKSWCSGHRKWIWTIVDDFETVIDSSITFYQSREEATLAAIDAALEYLSAHK